MRNGDTSACFTTRCWRCGGAAAGDRGHVCRRGQRWAWAAPGLRRDRAGGFQGGGRPQGFSRQLKNGLTPWQPLAVYWVLPFAPITGKGMFDYATGKWAPAKFHNYVTGEWIHGELSTDATHADRRLGSAAGTELYANRAGRLGRAEVAERRRESGAERAGGSAAIICGRLAGQQQAKPGEGSVSGGLFDNGKVDIDTLAGSCATWPRRAPVWLSDGLGKIGAGARRNSSDRRDQSAVEGARTCAVYRPDARSARRVEAERPRSRGQGPIWCSNSTPRSIEFQTALHDCWTGPDCLVRDPERAAEDSAATQPMRPRSSVSPGEDFQVRVHTAQGAGP